jgi:hypothetical protein
MGGGKVTRAKNRNEVMKTLASGHLRSRSVSPMNGEEPLEAVVQAIPPLAGLSARLEAEAL